MSAEEYRQKMIAEAANLTGTGSGAVRHACLPFTRPVEISTIISLDRSERPICLRRDGRRRRLSVGELENILSVAPARKDDKLSAESNLNQTQARLNAEQCYAAIADEETAEAVLIWLEDKISDSDDDDDIRQLRGIIRRLEAAQQMRFSRLLPTLSAGCAYRFWAPEGVETLDDWLDYFGLRNSAAGLFALADKITDAEPSRIPPAKAAIERPEVQLVHDRLYTSLRQRVSTYYNIESIRAAEALHSAADPVNVGYAIAAGTAAVVGTAEPVKSGPNCFELVFTSGFRSRTGRKMMFFSQGMKYLAEGTVESTSLTGDHLSAVVRFTKRDADLIEKTGMIAIESPVVVFRKPARVTSAWMTLEGREIATSIRAGRSVPAHVIVAGADRE